MNFENEKTEGVNEKENKEKKMLKSFMNLFCNNKHKVT